MGYTVLWREKGKFGRNRPAWQSFLTKKKADSFAKLVKKDKLTTSVKILKGR